MANVYHIFDIALSTGLFKDQKSIFIIGLCDRKIPRRSSCSTIARDKVALVIENVSRRSRTQGNFGYFHWPKRRDISFQ